MAWKLFEGDCLEIMPTIPDKRVDMILCDLPYGTTQNKWDSVIDLKSLWKEYKRIIKDNGAIVLTSSQPFTAALISSNTTMFKYDLIWDKKRSSGFLNANRMPLRSHEHILVFYKKLPIYNPQFTAGEPSHSKGKMTTDVNNNYGNYGKVDNTKKHGDKKFPKSILKFIKPHPPIHPTQKPVKLFEYLIKTYTNEGDLVLDNCAGSGTTGVACYNLNRDCVLIEKEPEYCSIIKDRMNEVESQPTLTNF